MTTILGIIFDLAKPLWPYIVAIFGLASAAVTLYIKGQESQKQKDTINTQKETINAYQNRTAVEVTDAAKSDTERDSMLHTWDRDKPVK